MGSTFGQFCSFALAALLLTLGLGQVSLAEPNTAAAPVSSSIKQAIQAIFRDTPAPLSETADKDLFQVELASLEYVDRVGKSLATEEYKSKKVLVYFWSIYCRGCIAPARELESLRSALKESDIEIVTVHLFESDRAKILNRLAQLSLGLPVLFGPNEVRDLFSVRVLPTALVFNDEHKVVARFEGGFDKEGLRLKVTKSLESRITGVEAEGDSLAKVAP